MKKDFFNIYQYLGPLIFTPLSFWLWWQTYEYNILLTLNAWLIPILFAYIVPGIGTNILKVWEINTKYRIGKFRPHHGFVFGSATSMIAWLVHSSMAVNIFDIFQYSFICASVLGFWNLIYDIKAIKNGMLLVYNQPWADGEGAEAIAMDYAPIFFAGFGLVYGFGISMGEVLYSQELFSGTFTYLYIFTFLIVSLLAPVFLYRYQSFKNHGHSGCKKVSKD